MKARPILFSAPMVRAILEGRKTQTRRVVKFRDRAPADWQYLQPMHGTSPPPNPTRFGNPLQWRIVGPDYPDDNRDDVFCPYGAPGDLLWVRETFAKVPGQTQDWIATDYRATYEQGERLGDSLGVKKKWTPAIHMPRAASRITLRVKDVRVERLEEITEADAIAEGITCERCIVDVKCYGGLPIEEHADRYFYDDCVEGDYETAVEAYAMLWDDINGAGSWARNPWVWAISFERVTP